MLLIIPGTIIVPEVEKTVKSMQPASSRKTECKAMSPSNKLDALSCVSGFSSEK